MREKLLLAAILTLTLRLIAGVNWSVSAQAAGTMNSQNNRSVTISQLYNYIGD